MLTRETWISQEAAISNIRPHNAIANQLGITTAAVTTEAQAEETVTQDDV